MLAYTLRRTGILVPVRRIACRQLYARQGGQLSNGEPAQLYRQAYLSTIETQWAMPSLSRTVLFLDDVISCQAYCFVLARLVILMCHHLDVSAVCCCCSYCSGQVAPVMSWAETQPKWLE